MKKLGFTLAALLLAVASSGCANRATAKVDRSADLAAIKTMHVVKVPEETAGIDALIADDLRRRGYTVTQGVEKPSNVDATVTYIDRWM